MLFKENNTTAITEYALSLEAAIASLLYDIKNIITLQPREYGATPSQNHFTTCPPREYIHRSALTSNMI